MGGGGVTKLKNRNVNDEQNETIDKHGMMPFKIQNWTQTGRGGRGQSKPQERGLQTLPVQVPISWSEHPTTPAWGTGIHLKASHKYASWSSRPGGRYLPHSGSTVSTLSSFMRGHVSRLEMQPILLAELKKPVVENTNHDPLPVLGVGLGSGNIENPSQT